MKQITIFICEDEKTRKEVMNYFAEGQITYANIIPAENREKVVKAIEDLEL